MIKNNILTAEDIDSNKKSIDKQIEENVITFNKQRIRKRLRELKAKLKLEYPDEPDKQIVPKEIQKQVTEEIINDNDSKIFREQQKESLQVTKDNYYLLRQTIQGLNDLNEFSAEIERNDIQKIDNFLTYEKIINYSLSKLVLFKNICKIRKENIDKFISQYKDKQLSFKSDSLDLLLNMREIYKVDKTIDDIELYEKFDMENNIDMSNKLADICFHNVTKGNNTSNIINEFARKNNDVNKLMTQNIITNKMLGILLKSSAQTNKSSFVSNNIITCMKTMWVNNTNNQMIYCTRTLGELLYEITNTDNKDIDKKFRQQIYLTYDGTRPTSDEYHKWNGLQVYDIDLKKWEGGNIDLLKQKMFEYLSEFHWFLWICKSASGKGIHIYTKVSAPHHVYVNPQDNEYISKYWFHVNYVTKLSIVYDILRKLHKDSKSNIRFDNCFVEEFENKFVDNSVGRITSGIRLTYDSMPLVNQNFIDLHVGLDLSQTNDGFEYSNSIDNVILRKTTLNKKLIDNIDNNLVVEDIDSMKEDKPVDIDLSKFVSVGADISDIKALPKSSINYQLRYNVVNTLAALFGKDALQLAHTLLDSKACGNVGEINSFYSCAISNTKKPSKMGLDILKKCGIIKSIEPELKDVVDNNFKNGIKKAIVNSLDNKLIKANIELSSNEYLSDKQDILLNDSKGGLTNKKINIVLSPAGSGKTEWIKGLARQGKRVMLVLPYISVIKNKVEIDDELMKMFECYYGSKDIKDIEYGINAVTTFDKFARANYEKLSKIFDYIFIDESHLIFTSSYRIEATSNVIKKIKDLFFVSSNDPFAAKLTLMTGTQTGEDYFFGNVANIIRVSKKSHDKTMEFLICDNILDCTTRMADRVFTLINDGYKILIPTNKGEIYSEKIIGMVEYLLGRPLKYGYYKRSNTDQEICRLINDNNTVGDYDIIFCSNYLSVGVDINDRVKFASIYLGPFSGYEIEQFNARVRKMGIKSLYCIQTENNDGTTNDMLLEEPNLLLKITEEDRDNFLDDKAISSAKQEFIAQYDPVLRKVTTPGFSYVNGKYGFNLEEYELISFENKYNECMQHPVKVARELDKYGYKITVSTEFDGLDLKQQEELKSIGIEAAKEEKIRKHNLLVGTFIDLVEQNTYTNRNGLEFNEVIIWLGKHADLIVEDRSIEKFVEIKFDVFATPISVKVKSKEAFDSMYKPAKYLISKYSVTKAIDIISQYVDESGILKQKNFKRAINLLKLIDSSDANELADPLSKVLEKIYDFVDNFESNKANRISYNTYKATLDEWTNQYIDLLGIRINTQYAFEKIEDSISEMLADIATKSNDKSGIKFTYNKMPDQNSNSVLNRRSVDTMVQNIFKLTSDVILTNKKHNPRKKHIVLITQNF